jgi:hypothetical protein
MANNSFRYVGAGTTFLSPTDFIVQVDTSAGAVTIVLPKISTIINTFTTIYQYIGVRLVDISNNASVNNITILGFETDVVNGGASVVLDTNGAGGLISLLGESQWSFNQNSVGGGISAPIDIVYADLYSKVVNNELVSSQWYRLTDYKSVNFLNGYQCAFLDSNLDNSPATDPAFVPRAIYTGNSEVLLLQAISVSELSPIGYSETFEGDIIEYQPLTNKIGVLTQFVDGGTLPNGNPISGFGLQWDAVNNEAYFDMPTGYPMLYGQVMQLYAFFIDNLGNKYDQDGRFLTTQNVTLPEISFTNDNLVLNNPKQTSSILIKNNGTRVVLVDLTQNDVSAYQIGTLSVYTTFQLGNAYGWITKRTNPLTNTTTPFDFRGRKFRRFEVDLSPFNSDLGTVYGGIGDNFGGLGTTGFFSDFKVFENATNLNWTGLGFGFDSIGDNDNNVFFGYVADVTIKNGCANNSLGVGNSSFNTPVFENSFIDNYFRLNVIGIGFSNNSIGTSFQQNAIADSFENNIIPRNFVGNFNILSNFRRNTFNVDTQGVDYSSANYVYGNYTCTINRRQDGTSTISYVDNVNVYQTTSPANS